MVMVFCTKIMRPGWGRIGKISENIVLPRTVSTASAVGGLVGAVIGALVGILVVQYALDDFTAVMGSMAMGCMIGVALVGWEPWRGEHLGWVALTKLRAFQTVRKMQCPGASRLPVLDVSTGQYSCPECALIVEPEDDLTPTHEWKRRMYMGIMAVETPQTGEIMIVPSSVVVPEKFRERTARNKQNIG